MSSYQGSIRTQSTKRTETSSKLHGSGKKIIVNNIPVAGVRTGRDQRSKDYAQLYANENAPRIRLQDMPTFMPKRNVIEKSIPGYSGHIPAAYVENTHALTFQNTKQQALAMTDARRKGGLSATLDKQQPKELFGTMTGAIPGYSGYIPHKQAENLYGRTFKRENRVARHLVEQGTRRTLPQDANGLSLTYNREPYFTAETSQPRKRGSTPPPLTGIPGYTGYFPKYMEEQQWLTKNFLNKGLVNSRH